jgi:excisionase family DNA binding protein
MPTNDNFGINRPPTTQEPFSRAALTEKEAAHYLGLGVGTLQKSRMIGNLRGKLPPPPFIKLGKAVRYLKADLDKWLERHRVVQEEWVRG